MRKVDEGSNIARGRKKRTNMRKQVVKNPATVAQTIRLRILFTGGSDLLSTTGPAGGRAAGGAFFTGGAGRV